MTTGQATSRATPVDLAQALRPGLAERAAEVDAGAVFPVENLAELRSSGLLGLLVPREYGGLGGDLGDLIEVSQILAGGCLSTAMIWAMHCQQVDALVRHAGERLRADLLPRIAWGEVYIASVTTEPGKGGHLLSAQAALVEEGEMLQVDRDSPVITGAGHADGFLVTMRADDAAANGRTSLVYLDRAQVELMPYGTWDALGMRGTQSAGARLTGSVPPDQVVGESGGFRRVATDSMIVLAHLGWSACWLGAARSALSAFVELQRSPGRPRRLDPRSDLAMERLGRIRLDLELVGAYLHRVCDEAVLDRAAGRSHDTASSQIHLNTLKVVAAELTFQAVDRLVQLAGLSAGYLKNPEMPLERIFRDLRSASLNYSNDRLLTATGVLALRDRAVRLA